MAKIDYDTPYNTSHTPNNTITGKDVSTMLNDIKALTTGEWLYLISFGLVVAAIYITAEILY